MLRSLDDLLQTQRDQDADDDDGDLADELAHAVKRLGLMNVHVDRPVASASSYARRCLVN